MDRSRIVGPLLFTGLLIMILVGVGLRGPDEQLSVGDDDATGPQVAEGNGSPIVGLHLLAKLPLQVPNADVWYHEGHAYVGTWAGTCPGVGVKVIDVRDPSDPRLVSSLAAHENTSAEDVVVLHVEAPRFTGDLLAVGLQTCNPVGKAGVELWNVTDPVRPQFLAFFHVPSGGVHELSMVQRPSDGRVLALLAVPYAESANMGGDFRIVDVTDPFNPVLASDWGITRERGRSPSDGMGAMPVVYDHSTAASADGLTAYVSYWDAGVQILDITNPESPQFIGNTTYPPGVEGNAHSVGVAPERNLLILADEDFTNRKLQAQVTGASNLTGPVDIGEATFGPKLNETNALNGTLVNLGRGCANDTYPADPRGAIAFVVRGDCLFTEKVAKAQAAGAIGVLVANNVEGGAIPLGGEDANLTILSYMVDKATGDAINASLAANETVTVVVSLNVASYDPWGGLRFFDISDPGRPVQVGEYHTAHGLNSPRTDDGGRYSVHNPVWLPHDEAVVASWFSDGVRILDLSDPAHAVEIASWVPEDRPRGAEPTGIESRLGGDEDKADIWGVFVDGDRIYASDVGFGIYVLEIERLPPN